MIEDYEISKKRDIAATLTFQVDNVTIIHDSRVFPLIDDDKYALAMLGFKNSTGSPVTTIEFTSKGVVMTPMTTSLLDKRDGLSSNYYVSGSGSVVFECQYGAGESYDSWIDIYNGILSEGSSHLEYYQYHAFHGYVGSDSRLKCAAKTYNDDEDFSTWRAWDDVWSSF